MHTVLSLFITSLTATRAADVTSNDGLLAYFGIACPTGWTDVTTNPNDNTNIYRGRIVKGTTNGNGVGATSTATALANEALPTHTHTSWSVSLTWTSGHSKVLASESNSDAADVNVLNTLTQSTSTMSSDVSNVPFVSLNLCQFTSGSSFNVPSGTVAWFKHTTTACPTSNGWGGEFSDANNGRLLVFASATITVSSSGPVSPAAVAGNGVNLGLHSHAIPAYTFNLVGRGIVGSNGCCSRSLANYAPTASWSTGTTSTDGLNIPYVQLLACVATGVGSNLATGPHPNAVLFYNGNTCDSANGWYEATTTLTGHTAIAGRVPWNPYGTGSPLNVRGGSQLSYAMTTGASDGGADSHTHTISASAYSFAANGIAGSWSDPGTEYIKYSPYAFSMTTSPSTQPTNSPTSAVLPYRVMRACSYVAPTSAQPSASPTTKPTSKPSVTPSTSKPSRTPSRAPSTSKPSHSPSHAPSTSHPSKSPTHTPSKQPTKLGVTFTPSTRPTSAAPSRAPSRTPSRVPSAAPLSSKPSHSPSQTPTSSKPSKSPSQTPSTSKPSRTPSRAPTKPGQTYSPTTSKAPSHSPVPKSSAPSHSPSSSLRKTTAPTSTTAAPTQPSMSPTDVGAAAANTNTGPDSTMNPIPVAVGAGVAVMVVALIAAGIIYRKRQSRQKADANVFGARTSGKNSSKTNNNSQHISGMSDEQHSKKSHISLVYNPMANTFSAENPLFSRERMMSSASSGIMMPPPPGLDMPPPLGPSERRVAHNYQAQQPDELTVFRGEIITIVEIHDQWVVARNRRDYFGLVPLTYLEAQQ